MIVGCGVDLCAISRIQRMLDKGFARRYFTDEEQAYLAERANAAESAAGMFAAKEAMLKALGTGIAGIGLLAVAVAHDAQGAPIAALTGAAAERLTAIGGARMHLSISHEGDTAVAMAIAESI